MLDKNYNALNFIRTVSRHEMIKIHLDATSLHFFYHSKVLVFMNTKKKHFSYFYNGLFMPLPRLLEILIT